MMRIVRLQPLVDVGAQGAHAELSDARDEVSAWENVGLVRRSRGRYSKVQSRKVGPAPGRFELSKGILK